MEGIVSHQNQSNNQTFVHNIAYGKPILIDRGRAILVDSFISTLIYLTALVFLNELMFDIQIDQLLSLTNLPLQGLGWYVTNTFYFALFESSLGKTPGKDLFNLEVINEEGYWPTFDQAFTRNILRLVDMIPVLPPYIIGTLTALSNSWGQRLGDIAAKTVVIKILQTQSPS